VIVPPGGTDPGDPATTCSDSGTPSCSDPDDTVADQFEATLDVQRAGSAAPGATIDLIVAKDTSTTSGIQLAVEYAIDTSPPPAKVLSISYLTCEADNGPAVVHSLDDMFSQAAAEGISVFVASGDSGAAGCADHTVAPTTGQVPGTNALCSSGQVTCVGGTQFADTAQPSLYWSASNGPHYLSALGYIPEGAWNEPVSSSGASQLGATGGGDIGEHFPDTDEQFKGAPSSMFLNKVFSELRAAGWSVVNVDVTILTEKPKLKSFKAKIAEKLSAMLGAPVNIKAGTNEGCDAIGRGEAIAAHAVVLLSHNK
jgi:2-C-methyl-D-erythritol 2,4-cyclodiphosphate synthase